MTNHTDKYAKQKAEIRSALAEMGLKIDAHFIPQRMSRNAGEKDKSINWKITLTRTDRPGRKPYTFDYAQGIGHVPGYQLIGAANILDADFRKACNDAAETGVYPRSRTYLLPKKLPPPNIVDVLHCVIQDTMGVIDSVSFEEWANEYGYDTDSRKAERIYQSCREQAAAIMHILNRDELSRLAELFQDY